MSNSYHYCTTNIRNQNYSTRYKKTDEYVLLGNCIEPIYLDTVTKEKYYQEADEFMVLYSPVLDNPLLDMQQVREEYPEVLI